MIITSDIHTHTVHSHGLGTVEENVIAAIKKGLKTIAISDHGPGHMAYGIKDIDKYLEDILKCKEKYKALIDVKSSIELNIISLDGDLDIPKGYEESFDQLIFGYHKFVRVKNPAAFFEFYLPKSHSEKAIQKNTDAYIKAIQRYKIDIISHPGYGLPIDKVRLAQEAVKNGVALEINAKHPEFTLDELNKCMETGVMFTINSDAHSVDRIGDIQNALNKAYSANVPPSRILGAQEV